MAPRRAFTKRRSHKRAAAATEPHVSYHRPSCVNRQTEDHTNCPLHNLTTGAYTHTERLSQFSLGRASTPPCDSHAPIRRRRCTAPAPIIPLLSPLISLLHTPRCSHKNHRPLKTTQFRWSAHWKRSGSYSHFSGKGRMLVAPTIMSAVFLRRRKTFCWTYGTLYFSQIARMRGADF